MKCELDARRNVLFWTHPSRCGLEVVRIFLFEVSCSEPILRDVRLRLVWFVALVPVDRDFLV